jgi:integral membrane protein (TIGR00529 family)
MIDILLNLPAFVKVAVCFASILAVCRFGLSLGWSIIIHSIILSFWTGAGARVIPWQASGFIKPENYLMFLAILALLYFTEALNSTGRMKRTVDALKNRISSFKAVIAGLPALVGLLPMPGGAIVSAPLVKSVDEKDELPAQLKVAINYWFRHIWECWWPLYPGVMLAIRYCGLPVGAFMLIMMPFTVVTAVSGYLFILKHVHKPAGWGEGRTTCGKLDKGAVFATMGPIGLLVIIAVSGAWLLPFAGVPSSISNLVAMLSGMLVAIPLVFGKNKAAFKKSLSIFRDNKIHSMMLVVLGVQMFSMALKLPLDASGATLVSGMRDEFLRTGVPIVIVMMLLPFVSGFIIGIAFGFVGASFPLVFGLLGPDPSFSQLASTTVLAYAFGYMGMILSPVHICFVVTNEYFKSRIFKAYPYIIWPVIITMIWAVLLSTVLYFLL